MASPTVDPAGVRGLFRKVFGRVEPAIGSVVVEHPNEPSGMAEIAYDAFESGLTSAGWYVVTSNESNAHPNGAAFTLERDTAAPDGPGILAKNWPAGQTAGTDATRLSSVDFSARELYLDFWLKPSSTFRGHRTGVNKIFFWGTLTSGAEMFANAKCSGAAPCLLEIRLQYPSPMGTRRFQYNGEYTGSTSVSANGVDPTSAQATIARGRWNRIEIHVVGNATGSSDGELYFWLNGVQIGSYSAGWEFLSGALGKSRLYPILGGVGGTVPADMEFQYDGVYLSGKN